jgi:GIY-YIG catalytic domain
LGWINVGGASTLGDKPTIPTGKIRSYLITFKSYVMTELETQARQILDFLVQQPFAECISISRDFAGLSTKPSIYAIRHRSEGLLYIGKAQDVKERFRGGHKAVTWAWLADYNHRDVVISTHEIDYRQWRTLSSDLEGIILVWSKPPFNIRIPMRDESWQ